MAHAPTPHQPQAPVPPPPSDSENQAIIDAEKTFRITLISAALFVAAALLIILRTRMG
jgi:hypothetical protein